MQLAALLRLREIEFTVIRAGLLIISDDAAIMRQLLIYVCAK